MVALGIVAIFAVILVGAGLIGLVVYLDYRQRRDVLASPPVTYHVQTMQVLQAPPQVRALPPGDDDMEGVVGMVTPREVMLLPRGARR